MAATLDSDPATTAAASAALTALASLEGLSPGSLQTMMLEVSASSTLCSTMNDYVMLCKVHSSGVMTAPTILCLVKACLCHCNDGHVGYT